MRIPITIAAALTLSAICFGQDKKVEIKTVPIEYTNPGSGAEMFKSYCAACHGTDGKGTGPAAPALKKAPTDLTLLTRKNNGKFPSLSVQGTIKGDTAPMAHGTRDMPTWGSLFNSVNSDPGVAQIRIRNLSDYIEGIQQK